MLLQIVSLMTYLANTFPLIHSINFTFPYLKQLAYINTFAYMFTHTVTGCPDGQFYSTFVGACLDCPENSTSSNGDAPLECTCADGYYFRPRGSNHNESCGKKMRLMLCLQGISLEGSAWFQNRNQDIITYTLLKGVCFNIAK